MKTKLFLSILLISLICNAQTYETTLNSGILLNQQNTGNITDVTVSLPLIKNFRINSSAYISNQNMVSNVANNNFGLSLSPTYRINLKKIHSDIFLGMGYAKTKISDNTKFYKDTDILIESYAVKNNNWIANFGVNISYDINKNWSVNSKIQKTNYINNPLQYDTKDISSAIKDDRINYELANAIPFESKEISFSNTSILVGIKYQFHKKKPSKIVKNPKKEIQQHSKDTSERHTPFHNKYRPQFSNTNNNDENPQATNARNGNPDSANQGTNPISIQATDWNSTRSNKTSKTTGVIIGNGDDNGDDNDDEGDENPQATNARNGNPDSKTNTTKRKGRKKLRATTSKLEVLE